MAEPLMLTTVDNPYNPRTDYDAWLQWDHDNEYFTQEYLSRLANPDPDMDEEEEDELYAQATQEIIEADVLGVYKLV